MGEARRKKAKGVLADHRREGKRFIPPLLDVGMMVAATWREVSIPELIWISLLVDGLGEQRGIETALRVAEAATRVHLSKQKKLYSNISSYASFREEQKAAILADLKQNGHADSVAGCLRPLLYFYPSCPLAFLGRSDASASDLSAFKEVLSEMFDKAGRHAMMVQAGMVYIAGVTGVLHLVEGVDFGDLNDLTSYPDTEESQRVAASVRATVSALLGGPHAVRREWADAFWQRGLELEKCHLSTE